MMMGPVAATGPRSQSAAVLIRLTLDTCVQPRPWTGIVVVVIVLLVAVVVIVVVCIPMIWHQQGSSPWRFSPEALLSLQASNDTLVRSCMGRSPCCSFPAWDTCFHACWRFSAYKGTPTSW